MMDIARIFVPPLVWLATFSGVYGLHGVLCGLGIEGGGWGGLDLPRLLLVAAFAAAVAVQAVVLAALYAPRLGSPSPFIRFVSRATGWVGLIATAWSLFPVLAASYCL